MMTSHCSQTRLNDTYFTLKKKRRGKEYFMYCLSNWVYHKKYLVSLSMSEHIDQSHSLKYLELQ